MDEHDDYEQSYYDDEEDEHDEEEPPKSQEYQKMLGAAEALARTLSSLQITANLSINALIILICNAVIIQHKPDDLMESVKRSMDTYYKKAKEEHGL